jgi:hypothetical protein
MTFHPHGLPEPASDQTVFDRVVEHMLHQGRPSMAVPPGETEAQGRYRGADGLVCAIGRVIPDDAYSPAFEGKSLKGLLGEGRLPFLAPFRPILHGLQRIHDLAGCHPDGTFVQGALRRDLVAFARSCEGIRPYAALGIRPAEYDALLRVRAILADPAACPRFRFTMATWIAEPEEAGTACCIGGAMVLFLNDAFAQVVERGVSRWSLDPELRAALWTPTSPALEPLFLPLRGGDTMRCYGSYTPAEGLVALDAFLSGSVLPWTFTRTAAAR